MYTRFKQNSVIVTIGHSGQCDLPKKQQQTFCGHMPFELYAIHHGKRGGWTGELVTNYRGPFAKWSDEIQQTIDEMETET
jgi:hypothetical protein